MRSISKSNLRDKNKIALFLILITSFLLRFYNYPVRWGLAYDQARDVVVTHEALIRGTLPLTGPFSASGRFVFSPIWYWIHIFLTSLNPSSPMLLWYFQAMFSSLMPLVMYFVGKEIKDKKMGLFLAALTAVSTAQIAQATNLTYSTFVGFISMLLVLTLLMAMRTEKRYLFNITSFLIGLSLNIHFQAAGNIFFLFVLLYLKKKSWKDLLGIMFFFTLPFTPLIIFDFLHGHFESKFILEFLFKKGSASLPKRWLTYAFSFWPQVYSHVIGGNVLVGFFSALLILISLFSSIAKKNLSKPMIIILLFLSFNFILLRYSKGPTFDAFIVYLHPALLIITGWALYTVYTWKKILGLTVFCVIILFSLYKDYKEITYPTGAIITSSKNVMQVLSNKYPGSKFEIYDFKNRSSHNSLPAVMFMMKKGLLQDHGIKIGFMTATTSAELLPYSGSKITVEGNSTLFNLNKLSEKELEQRGWSNINPSKVYKSVVEWWYTEKIDF